MTDEFRNPLLDKISKLATDSTKDVEVLELHLKSKNPLTADEIHTDRKAFDLNHYLNEYQACGRLYKDVFVYSYAGLLKDQIFVKDVARAIEVSHDLALAAVKALKNKEKNGKR